MGTDLADPLADLKAEIEAEEAKNAEAAAAAEAEAKAAAETKTEEEPETKTEQEPAPAEAAGDAEEGKKEESEAVRRRINELNAARRQAEKESAKLRARIAELENGKPIPEPKQETQDERDNRIRAEAKAQAILEIQLTSFATAGVSAFGEAEFDNACNEIADVGGNRSIIQNALAALDSPEQAARAIWNLSQQDPAEVQRILALHPLRQATMLAKLANLRGKKEAEEEPEPRRPVRQAAKPAAPKPITPIGGGSSQPSKDFTDDMPEAEFDRLWRTDPRLGGPAQRQ